MKSYSIDKKRVVAFVGHAGGGKTQLCEAILHLTKATSQLGKVEGGNSNLDFEPEEQKRQYSVAASFWDVEYKDHHLFLMDTPGSSNFAGDARSVLNAAGVGVFAVDAVEGAKFQHMILSRYAADRNIPHMVFVSKMDREHANFAKAVESAKETLAVEPVVMALPIGKEADFKGVVDLISRKAFLVDATGKTTPAEIPADMVDDVDSARETMMERLVEADEELMEKFLEEGEVSDEDLHRCLKQGTINRIFAPLYVGSGITMGGVYFIPLLNGLLQAAPSPTEEPARKATNLETKEDMELAISDDGLLVAQVIKTMSDPFTGKINVFRVYRGKLSSDDTVENMNRSTKERFGKMFYLRGKKQESVEFGEAGEIVAVSKLKDLYTGDTFNIEKSREPVMLPVPQMADPMEHRAIYARKKGEEEKMGQAIQRTVEEDPGLTFWRDDQTYEFILSGVGGPQFDVAMERIRRKYQVEIDLNTPKVPYRETIKGKSEKQGRYKKQTGGRGQFGDCHIRVSPNPGKGYEFQNNIVGGVIPKQFIPAVDKGIQESMVKGELTGSPVVDVIIDLFFGSYHAVDSSENAFKVAGSMAWKAAMMEASPCVLEPIQKVDIMVPSEFMGDVFGYVSSRRGKVLGNEPARGLEVIHAVLPLAETFTLAQDLRAMTADRASFKSAFDHYEEVPSSVAEALIEDYKKRREDDNA